MRAGLRASDLGPPSAVARLHILTAGRLSPVRAGKGRRASHVEVADNLKNQNGFVPGIRPGKKTAEYLDYVVTRLLVLGSGYLALVCLIPEIFRSQFAITAYFGGTSILIIVSVGMDTIQQVQSHLLAHQYEGLLEKSQLRGKKRKKGGAARR